VGSSSGRWSPWRRDTCTSERTVRIVVIFAAGIETPVVAGGELLAVAAVVALRGEGVPVHRARGARTFGALLAFPLGVVVSRRAAPGAALGGAATGLDAEAPLLRRFRLLDDPVPALVLALALALTTTALSNVMSNTAATNVLVPIGLALAPELERHVVIPIALAASCAASLPVSTPPNALAFATGELEARDFRGLGFLLGLAGPVVSVAWCTLVDR
jgi:hypothetical protein